LYTTDRKIAMDNGIGFVENLIDLENIAFSYTLLDLEEIG